MKEYIDKITSGVNDKGVYDIDTVKGCELGLKNNPDGCWGLCYAKKIADRYGIDFSKSVVRRSESFSQIQKTIKEIKNLPILFSRIGTMGDPCHAWKQTISVCGWLTKTDKDIVIITKHWIKLTDEQMEKLGKLKVIINTSISALDTEAQREYRLKQYNRYKKFGKSILRIVSCKFNKKTYVGRCDKCPDQCGITM